MIVYVGNMLSKHGGSVGVIEVLGKQFAKKYDIVCVSDKKNMLMRMIHMIWTIYKNRKQCTLVLIDSYSTLAFWYTYIISRMCQSYEIPYIPILHGGNFPHRLEMSPNMCHKVFKRSIYNISPSFYLKEVFEKKGFVVNYLPNSIDITNYPFKFREKLSPKILWVRAFDKIYNPTLAPKVLKLILDKYPDAYLCMVGGDKDGSLSLVIKEANKLGVSDRIKYTGFLSKPEWLKLSEDYDVFLSTTNFDNHPVSLIESMALGLPIVSTNAGGVPFLIENGKEGLLSEINHAESLAKSIINLIENPVKAQSIAKQARLKAESFDWKNIEQKWYQTLSEFEPELGKK